MLYESGWGRTAPLTILNIICFLVMPIIEICKVRSIGNMWIWYDFDEIHKQSVEACRWRNYRRVFHFTITYLNIPNISVELGGLWAFYSVYIFSYNKWKGDGWSMGWSIVIGRVCFRYRTIFVIRSIQINLLDFHKLIDLLGSLFKNCCFKH